LRIADFKGVLMSLQRGFEAEGYARPPRMQVSTVASPFRT